MIGFVLLGTNDFSIAGRFFCDPDGNKLSVFCMTAAWAFMVVEVLPAKALRRVP